MNKRTIPNLLQVDRTDGTFVMDCDSGIALIAMPRSELAAQKAGRVADETAPDPKTKTNWS